MTRARFFSFCFAAAVIFSCSSMEAQRYGRHAFSKPIQQHHRNMQVLTSEFDGIRTASSSGRSSYNEAVGTTDRARPVVSYGYSKAGSVMEPRHAGFVSQRSEPKLYEFPTMGYQPDERGFYPYVTGDIFGVSRQECCDEWNGHCECLELTSRHKKCECKGYSSYSAGCTGCADQGSFAAPTTLEPTYRESKRRSVSEYFHPTR